MNNLMLLLLVLEDRVCNLACNLVCKMLVDQEMDKLVVLILQVHFIN